MAPILTITIPTYNRADILNDTLQRLVTDPACNDRVEIVVSDNASTDHTAEIVAKYPSVKYFCNAENVVDANFTIAINHSSGLYVRLCNDTVRFREGMLEKMLRAIEQNRDQDINLFFIENNQFIKNKTVDICTAEQMLSQISYFITWIANFGVWKADFVTIDQPDRYLETKLLQVDWILQLMQNGKSTRIISDNYFEVSVTKNKGNYNIFDIFINKYLFLLDLHKISFWGYEKAKYELFRHFIIGWYFLLKNDKEYTFDTSGCNIIYKRYWYEPYFLPLMVLGWMKDNIKRRRLHF